MIGVRHLLILDEVRSTIQLVTEPNQQEQRNTDVRCRHAIPVDVIFQKRLIVLPQRDDQTEHKRENLPSGKKRD